MIKITQFAEKRQKEKLAVDPKERFEEIDAAELSAGEKVGP